MKRWNNEPTVVDFKDLADYLIQFPNGKLAPKKMPIEIGNPSPTPKRTQRKIC
jgi:hypothetical protein